jgi:rubrerythrin
MRGILRRWLLVRVIKSALVFEREAIALYRNLQEKIREGPAREGLAHLLDEEEVHWKILTDAAAGKLDPDELDRILKDHLYTALPSIQPIPRELRGLWEEELSRALEREKDTFIFYSNLRRTSKIPAVKRAFEALADMEKEHVDILSKLLGTGGE